jgi:hypothetical protein
MNMKTKSPKLKVTHDYITLSLPVGNYTVSFNGRKASGQLATMKGAFATLNKYVDQESKTKSYGEVMEQLTNIEVLNQVFPEWNQAKEVDTFKVGDFATFDTEATAFIKKYGNGPFEVVSVKPKYIGLKTPLGNIGFPKINLVKIK